MTQSQFVNQYLNLCSYGISYTKYHMMRRSRRTERNFNPMNHQQFQLRPNFWHWFISAIKKQSRNSLVTFVFWRIFVSSYQMVSWKISIFIGRKFFSMIRGSHVNLYFFVLTCGFHTSCCIGGSKHAISRVTETIWVFSSRHSWCYWLGTRLQRKTRTHT